MAKMARSWIALATMVAVLGHARSDGAAVDRRSLLQVFESNPFPSIDLSALESIGFVPPPDLASGGSAPTPAPSPAPALEGALSALPVGDLVPVPDLSDPLGSLEASLPGLGGGGGGGDGGGDGSGTDEIVIPEGGANETTVDGSEEATVDGSGEAVPVNGTTADDSAESEPVPSGQFDCSPTCDEAGTDLGGCEICTGDCECADPGEGPQVNNPVTPGLLPGQFVCSPTCDPTKLGGCDICTGDCECADPSRGTPPGEGPQVNNTVTPGLPPGQYECKDKCEGCNLGCDICTGNCECANPPKGPQTLEIVQQINGTDAVMPLFVVEVTSTKDKEKYNKTYLMPLLPGSIPCAPECLEPNYTGEPPRQEIIFRVRS